MRWATLTILMVLVTAACGGSTEDTTTTAAAAPPTTTTTTQAPISTTTTTTLPPTDRVFSFTGIVFGDTSPMVVIKNLSDQGQDLSDHWVCQDDACYKFDGVGLGADQSLALSLGGPDFKPPPDAFTIDVAVNLGDIDPVTGELALHLSGDFENVDHMIAYVEWGEAGHSRSGVAIEADVWRNNSFLNTTEDSIAAIATNDPADEPEHWAVLTDAG